MMRTRTNPRSLILLLALIAIWQTGVVGATTTAVPTSGLQGLKDRINDTEARLAELNVDLDPSTGITHTLDRTSRGNDVKLLQQFLKEYGVYPEALVTGNYGPLTENAVKRFQIKESIDPVGIVGPITRSRIREISQKRVADADVGTPAATSTYVTDAVLTTAIAENGSAAGSTTAFTTGVQNIYAVIAVKNAVQTTEIGYIRYHHGAYVDSGVTHPSRDGLTYIHFQWALKPGSSRVAGDYSMSFYLNGKKAKTVDYTIH